MNWINHLKHIILSFVATITLTSLGLSPHLQAAPQVVPVPDGCYPGFTTAEGCKALQFLGAGAGNTGFGWYSLFSVGGGNFNTGVGAGTLVLNTADSNTAVGAAALLLNTSGTENVAVGTDALVFNDTGGFNTAVGTFAMFNNTQGNGNIAVGRHALFANVNGNSNVAVGVSALEDNTSGIENAAVGGAALLSNVDGHDNVAVGQAALSNNTSGFNNIGIGFFGGLSVTTSHDVICIGVQGQDMSNSCFIGQIFGATVPGGTNVVIDSNNRLGNMTSSKRYKENIEPMEEASDALFALKPVKFRYKKEIDPAGASQFGLVAEDVEKVNPELIVRDKEGKAYSVRYDQVNAMMLNEFLKEHRKVGELQAGLAQQQKEFQAIVRHQQKQIDALTAGLQKVSVQLEVGKPAQQTVLSNK
jgi:hypothetical protein